METHTKRELKKLVHIAKFENIIKKLNEFLQGGPPDKESIRAGIYLPITKEGKTILEVIPVNRIKEIPYIWEEAFFPEKFTLRPFGDSVYHIAAKRGFLDQCPNPTPAALTCTNKLQSTPLDYAANSGTLTQIPKALLLELLPENISAIHQAALRKQLDQVPNELFTESLVEAIHDSRTLVQTAAEGGSLLQLPPKFVTTKSLIEIRRNDNSALHIAAESGTLDQVPQEFITKVNLATYDTSGQTVAQVAAANGHLSQITLKLAQELMFVYMEQPCMTVSMSGAVTRGNDPEPDFKSNLLHCAAAKGKLDKVPAELFTEKAMTEQNASGHTVLHIAACKECFDQIPPKYITNTALLTSCHNAAEATIEEILGIGDKGTVLECIHANQLGCLMHVELSEECKDYVSKDWWDSYKSIQKRKANLEEKEEQANEIDIF